MEITKNVVLVIIIFFILLGYNWFVLRPITRKFAYKEAVENQYFIYDSKTYKVELVDGLEKPEIEDKE